MPEDQEFQDWTTEQDDRLRAALGSLRQDVDAAGLPDVRFVYRRAGQHRQSAVAGLAAGAAAVVGLSWFGIHAMTGTPSTAPAHDGTVSTQVETSGDTDGDRESASADPSQEHQTESESPSESTDAAPVFPDDLFSSEGRAPDPALFVPPTLWSSDVFTGGTATDVGGADWEGTGIFNCDSDDVLWGTPEEGTFGIMKIWSGGSAFASQRVRVLDSPEAATTYVNDMETALADCTAPADATNLILDVQPLSLSGAYRMTTEFVDGSEPITEFVYVVQHDGTPESVSTFDLVDWSGKATDTEAVDEFERLAGLVTDK